VSLEGRQLCERHRDQPAIQRMEIRRRPEGVAQLLR
jgi:hypothetical protein